MKRTIDKSKDLVLQAKKDEKKNGTGQRKSEAKGEITKLELEKMLTSEQIAEQLEKSIIKFQEINQTISDRNTFLDKKTALTSFLEELNEEVKEGLFESKSCKISLQGAHSERNLISIGNAEIVREFLVFVIQKIDKKVSELEAKITF